MKETSRLTGYILLAFTIAVTGVYLLAFKSGLSDNIISFIIFAPLTCFCVWLIVTVWKTRVNAPHFPELPEDENIVEGEIID